MKKLLLISAMTCAVFCAGHAHARMAVVIFPAEIKGSCAPWDGAASSIKVDLHFGVFTGNVYGRGLADLSMGKEVTLDGGSNPESTGFGNICLPDGECIVVKAKIQIPPKGAVESAQGTLTIPPWGEMPEVQYFIEPKMVEGKAVCG